MSRTYNHRPRWVKLNDPKFPTRERHQHYVVKREKTGHYEEITRYKWVGEPRYTEPYTVLIPEYRQWVEEVPCTIHLPEVSWMSERNRKMNGTLEKLCDKRELIWSCPCCSRKSLKQDGNRARRVRINQQLHNAVRDYGRTTEANEWYDVDISEAHRVYHDYDWD